MGVTRWLDCIDPATWEVAVKRISAAGTNLLRKGEAMKFLREFGRKPTDDLWSLLDEAEDEGLQAETLNELLELAVTDKSWDLGKSLKELRLIATLLPDASPLLKLIDFRRIDIEVPTPCRADEGLFGCCSSVNLQDCLDVVKRYSEPREVDLALESAGHGFTALFAGRSRKVSKARTLMGDDYHREYWPVLMASVSETVGSGKLLGLGMSS